ncbi:MAG: hypothetical protein FWH17_02810 [Oscillospiraceae bacterium]|nr:hypothetical protein [Oscillospiraceae bacterium]
MPRTKSAALMDDPNVKELLSILKDSGRSPRELLDVIGSVTRMEQELSAALKGLNAIQGELSTMREERDHPVKTMLEKTSRSLTATVKGLFARIKAIKDGIVNGCKRAVAAFRDTGAVALNNLAQYFDIKQNLLDQRDDLNAAIEQTRKSIGKIEAAAEQYHTAGRAIRNIGRAMRGEAPIPDVKPNGKLARLLESPFAAQMNHLRDSLRSVNKSLARLDKLEKAATKAAEAERPSTRETMQRLQKQLDTEREDAPSRAKTKLKEAEI